jgi:hypothetical protein
MAAANVASFNHAVIDHRLSRPMVSVVRFCGLQRSSVVAGIQSGIKALKRLAIGLAPGATYVLYRNPQASTSTVTIEIGMPIPDEIAYRNTGELRFGRTPKGIALQGTPADLGASLSDVLIGLREAAAAEGLEYEPYWWQVLPDREDIEVNAQPPLNLPVRLPT